MRDYIYPTEKRKLELKRCHRKVLLLPLALLLPVCVLGVMSLTGGSQSVPHSAVQQGGTGQESGSSRHSGGPAADVQQASLTGQQGMLNGSLGPSAASAPKPEAEERVEAAVRVEEHEVQPGDTATSLLSDYMDEAEIYHLSRQSRDVYSLRRIRAGNAFRLYFRDDNLTRFEYDIDDERKLCVRFGENGTEVCREEIEYRVKRKLVEGTITTNLFETVEEAGESAQLAVKLAGIFAWDIDFIRDIRENDSFKLIVDKRYRDGEFAGYGDIEAAQFTNGGRTYQAFLFENVEGRCEYYTPEGQAVRKTFLKAPLNFTRISSGYSMHRRHPVLNVVRPHRGIDYAAPRGTPIESVADGEVIEKAYEKGAGRYVKIRHKNGYVTIYNHMSRYARKVHPGAEVAQGQTIGYVGSTGLSTGPHLDYRVKKFGDYINPLTIESKPVRPLPEDKMAAFKKKIQPLAAVLQGKKPMYAYAEQAAGTKPRKR
jgi:murein DD-endopeptidase MepM/ murein hydrolase activator NlpD